MNLLDYGTLYYIAVLSTPCLLILMIGVLCWICDGVGQCLRVLRDIRRMQAEK